MEFGILNFEVNRFDYDNAKTKIESGERIR